jgi:polysaccharide export outer membrane protein
MGRLLPAAERKLTVAKPHLSIASLFLFVATLAGQQVVVETSSLADRAPNQFAPPAGVMSYTLGPGDEITVNALELEEFKEGASRVDMEGNLRLPLIGKIRAAGLTPAELEAVIKRDLKVFVKDPDVIVTLLNFRSQPVMVLGAVDQPGTHQLEGRKTLFEVISSVGGIRVDAGPTILITREKEWGRIPLPGCTEDATGQFYVAEVSIKSVMEAKNPIENVLVKPRDVITVPKGQVIYVVGAVKKSGGYSLGEARSMTVLQALAMADGLDRLAAPRNARIMRVSPGGNARTEIPVDVKKIFDGKGNDVALGAEDILFIPNSGAKAAALRGAETVLGLSSTVLLLGAR